MEAVQCFCTFSHKKLSKLKPKPGSPTTPKPPLNITPQPRQKELPEVFRRFDSDCDGKISAVELRSYFASIGEYMSYEDAQAVISYLDSDNDGLLDFEDFLRLMEDNGGGRQGRRI
ncbi:UNVERIFIED_CONTAM: putative calcium-binding protein CML19 [Sesamum latifolium]|uniref:Calcium-binding protein CML19 n=1 Tax=Sesamum latifolium TaxID=2727402 RepID=A0AAW2Y710_9LAMI